ncbi:hypothetical protein BGY98DRAFT_939070 [Russula aff. rugulosa BPL654]|nr:hypothetical protein BGY98DRAFT_939070 [Russula aff. rugulosa BPL654]
MVKLRTDKVPDSTASSVEVRPHVNDLVNTANLWVWYPLLWPHSVRYNPITVSSVACSNREHERRSRICSTSATFPQESPSDSFWLINCIRRSRNPHTTLSVSPATHPNTEPAPAPEPGSDHAEELVHEQLAQNYAFLREDGVSRVRAASVVIVGCGGVGSWTAVMLARSGVAKLRLVDFDYVTLSSLNRHATAAIADVGTPKVECIVRALRAIAPYELPSYPADVLGDAKQHAGLGDRDPQSLTTEEKQNIIHAARQTESTKWWCSAPIWSQHHRQLPNRGLWHTHANAVVHATTWKTK